MHESTAYIEARNGGYYLKGTRVSLASVVHAFRRGEAPETILQTFPAIGSLLKVYGTITFMLGNPDIVEAYLAEQDRLWDQFRQDHPLSPEAMQAYESARTELGRKSA